MKSHEINQSFTLLPTVSFAARCNYRVNQSGDQRCRFPGSRCGKRAYTVFRSPSFSITRCIISSDSTPRVRANSIELSLKSSASRPLSLLYYFIFSPLTFCVRHGPSESIHGGQAGEVQIQYLKHRLRASYTESNFLLR